MNMRSILLALCEGNPPVTGGFPSQRASNAELLCFICHCNENMCMDCDLNISESGFHARVSKMVISLLHRKGPFRRNNIVIMQKK